MAKIDTLKIYEAIKDNWTKDPSRAVVEAIEESLEEYHNGQKDVLATKSDIKDLEVKMKEQEVRIIRWMFAFWITQFIAILGILIAK